MLQPFILLKQQHIDELEKVGKTFLVTQRYNRGINHLQNDNDKIDILVTDYPNRGLADIHYNAKRGNSIVASQEFRDAAAMLQPDKDYTAVINLKNANHYQTLQQMLLGDKYRLYWAITIDRLKVRQVIRSVYGQKIFHYLTAHLQWPIRGTDKLEIKEGVIFGELFVNLRWNSFKKRVPLIDIQQYQCV